MVDIDTRFINRRRKWGTTPRWNRVGVSIHHSVTSTGSSRESVDNLVRQINNQHPDGSYSYAVDYTGHIYEIVGVDGIGGAVGGKNTPWLAICYIGDGRYGFTREAERSIRQMVEYLDGLCGKRLAVAGHGELNATACPGHLIQARVNAGAFSQRYSTAHIIAVQNGLLKLGYDLGSWGADGDWGSYLSIATGQFQAKHGLLVDEIPGPATLAKINAEVAKLGTPTTPPVTPPALTYVRWTAPLEMEFTKAATLYDFGANAAVASSAFAAGDRITIVGEVQEEGAVYLMTDYSFADADVSKSPKFTRGILADTVQVYVAPPPEEEPEDPHPEPEDPPVEPEPEPEPTPGNKAALAAIIAAIVAALGALVAWLNGM